MKKSLLGLLLAIVMVAPVLALDMELIPKVGYLFTPEITSDGNTASKNSTFSLGADYFFKISKIDLFVGPGFMWEQKYKINDSDFKVGFTNIYAAIKYKFQVGKVNIYPFAQLGYGIDQIDDQKYVDEAYYNRVEKIEYDGGFYWGVGCGVEYSNVVLELLYGCNYGKWTYYDYYYGNVLYRKNSTNFTSTAFRVQLGYKFAL